MTTKINISTVSESLTLSKTDNKRPKNSILIKLVFPMYVNMIDACNKPYIEIESD